MSSIVLTDQQVTILLKEARDGLIAHLIKEHGEKASLLSPAQVCGLLDVTPKTLAELKIPRVVLGPQNIKYRLADVTAFIEARLER